MKWALNFTSLKANWRFKFIPILPLSKESKCVATSNQIPVTDVHEEFNSLLDKDMYSFFHSHQLFLNCHSEAVSCSRSGQHCAVASHFDARRISCLTVWCPLMGRTLYATADSQECKHIFSVSSHIWSILQKHSWNSFCCWWVAGYQPSMLRSLYVINICCSEWKTSVVLHMPLLQTKDFFVFYRWLTRDDCNVSAASCRSSPLIPWTLDLSNVAYGFFLFFSFFGDVGKRI